MAQTGKRPNPSNRPNRPSGAAKSASSAAKSSSSADKSASSEKSAPSAAKSAPSAAKKAAGRTTSSSAGRPPTRKPSKSIVNQKQTPWGLIATAVVLVLFAGAIVAYAVTRHKDSSPSAASAWAQPELAAAKKIAGVKYKPEPDHLHVTTTVKYDTSPPTGGNHSQVWALCDGVVYDHQIANENAVHMLEHGAIWITYNPKTLSPTNIAKLKTVVDGVNYLALSPYAGLKTPLSLQAWNYQLFLTSPTDPRLDQFIAALKFPSSNTPEPGAGCTGSGFVAKDSTLGHPYEG